MPNNAKLIDVASLIQAGINPKNGLPLRMSDKCNTKELIKQQLRIIDEQDAVNRYVWYNLPCDLTSQELERMLYYKGQLCFFYNKELDQFFFMPYALDGTIDFYGRYNHIHPIPMTSGTDEDDKKRVKTQSLYLSTIKLKCVYGQLTEEATLDEMLNSTVLLYDYTKQLSQKTTPRQVVNDGLLDIMADCIPFMRTSLLLGTGIKGLRVQDADQAKAVDEGAASMERAALNGNPWIPIEGALEFQELTDGQVAKSEEFMLAMQSLDNFRLSTYGIDNGGLFEKKAHELQSEADINGGPVGLVYQDGLSIRQNFCNIVNSIWDLGIWCEPSQNASGIDNDGDGAIYEDDSDGMNTGMEENGDAE